MGDGQGVGHSLSPMKSDIIIYHSYYKTPSFHSYNTIQIGYFAHF